MPGFRRSSIPRSARPRRPMDWGGFAFNGLVGAGVATGGWIVAPDDVREKYTDPTIMALRAKFAVRTSDSAPGPTSVDNSVSSPFGVYLGIIDWAGVAVAQDFDPATHAAVPNPLPLPGSQPNYDWMLRIALPIPPFTLAGTVFLSGGLDKEYMSAAKRRMGNNKGLLYVVQGTTFNGSYSLDLRYLLKE